MEVGSFFYLYYSMKSILDRIPPFLKNFYVLTSIVFVAWMVFFDSNDFISQVKLSSQQADLEEAKSFYQEKIIEVQEDRDALLNNDELLEKIAREKYFMQKPNEDVFIVVEE